MPWHYLRENSLPQLGILQLRVLHLQRTQKVEPGLGQFQVLSHLEPAREEKLKNLNLKAP